jgi:hypothetical protein
MELFSNGSEKKNEKEMKTADIKKRKNAGLCLRRY